MELSIAVIYGNKTLTIVSLGTPTSYIVEKIIPDEIRYKMEVPMERIKPIVSKQK